MLERDIHRFDYPNAWQPNNANGGTDYGEFPVIATLSQRNNSFGPGLSIINIHGGHSGQLRRAPTVILTA